MWKEIKKINNTNSPVHGHFSFVPFKNKNIYLISSTVEKPSDEHWFWRNHKYKYWSSYVHQNIIISTLKFKLYSNRNKTINIIIRVFQISFVQIWYWTIQHHLTFLLAIFESNSIMIVRVKNKF